MADMPAVDIGGWAPYFEPHDFNQAHGPLEVERYRISPEELSTWYQRAVKIRASILEKA